MARHKVEICGVNTANLKVLSNKEMIELFKKYKDGDKFAKEDLAKKPENIREKIVEGRLHKILAQKCLLEQGFVKDPSQTVAQLIEGKLHITKFVRYTLGEGLEKRNENFADEVMSQIKG